MQSDIVDSVYTAQASDLSKRLKEDMTVTSPKAEAISPAVKKQRLSIARAVCRHPEIFVFDDSFSALDYKTDRKLREALNKECADATKLCRSTENRNYT